MFKSRLQEYAQKNSFPLPVYATANDGEEHLPQFKCSVTVNGAKYDSPLGFKHKKEAENAAAQTAIEDLLKQGLDLKFEDTRLFKNVLNDFAIKKNIPLPTYQFSKEGDAHCPTFTATVEIKGASYTGAPGNNKKEAASKAAYEAIRSITTQDCNSFSQLELQVENKQSNDFKQPSEECKVTKSVSKIPADNYKFNNQLLAGKVYHSAENSTEKLNVDNAPALEKVPEKINVGDSCLVGQSLQKSMGKDSGEVENGKPNINDATAGSASVEQSQQDPILVEQHRLKEAKRIVYQNMECGTKELEGKQQGGQEVALTETIGKRRNDSENAEQVSEIKKKLKMKNKAKRKKSDGTA